MRHLLRKKIELKKIFLTLLKFWLRKLKDVKGTLLVFFP